MRWASVAALEFLQRSHDKEDHYTGTKERATCSSAFRQKGKKMHPESRDTPIRRREERTAGPEVMHAGRLVFYEISNPV